MDTGLTSDYIQAINDECADIADYIVAGKCKSMEVYREKVGHLRGLKQSERLLHDTIREATKLQEMD